MCNNFIRFLRTKPPLVLFLICLIFFTLVLCILDSYITKNEIPNIDTRQDWNKVLESMSHLEFCLSTNKTHRNHYLKYYNANKEAKRHYMLVTLKMYPSFNIINDKARLVNTIVTGKQLGMKGMYAEDKVNISFIIPPIQRINLTCYIRQKCDHVDVTACVVFETFSDMFPTKIKPLQCLNAPGDFITKSRYMLYLTWHRKETLFRYLSCSKQTSFWAEYVLNPGLTVMLTKEEVSVIHTHLSASILILCVLICFIIMYGMFYGGHGVSNETKIEYHLMNKSHFKSSHHSDR